MVCLAPKTYYSYDADANKAKFGQKGIPHDKEYNIEAFLQKLYNNNSDHVYLRGLRLNADREMVRITQRKKGLSDIFTKFHLDDDAITCRPLKYKNKIL